jgi:hypothetical protein
MRVDVTEEFRFLVTKLPSYYDRGTEAKHDRKFGWNETESGKCVPE